MLCHCKPEENGQTVVKSGYLSYHCIPGHPPLTSHQQGVTAHRTDPYSSQLCFVFGTILCYTKTLALFTKCK